MVAIIDGKSEMVPSAMAERLTLFRYLFEVVGVGLVLVGEHFGHERSDITGVL